jgi:hypothetical protein
VLIVQLFWRCATAWTCAYTRKLVPALKTQVGGYSEPAHFMNFFTDESKRLQVDKAEWGTFNFTAIEPILLQCFI